MDDVRRSASSKWRGRGALLAAVACFTFAGCGGASQALESGPPSPCTVLCGKYNECRAPGTAPLMCGYVCTYGGNVAAGLAPAPACPQATLTAQSSCVAAAVQLSCDAYQAAAHACPACPVLAGSPCKSHGDCQQYRLDYFCDSSRPGGYCTAACQKAADCAATSGGPEACVAARAPSFAPQAEATQGWCMLGCSADATCRVSDGYHCRASSTAAAATVCESP